MPSYTPADACPLQFQSQGLHVFGSPGHGQLCPGGTSRGWWGPAQVARTQPSVHRLRKARPFS